MGMMFLEAKLVQAPMFSSRCDPSGGMADFRFSLSFRDVEELMAARGVDVSYETVGCWKIKFGPLIARRLKKRRWPPTPRWQLEEVVCTIGGKWMFR